MALKRYATSYAMLHFIVVDIIEDMKYVDSIKAIMNCCTN
jgi:hypothetical protein